MDITSLVWGTNGKWAQCGRVKATLGRSENVSSSGSREGSVCNDALRVIGLYGPGDKISFSCRIGSWQRWH